MGIGLSEKDVTTFIWGLFGVGAIAGIAFFAMLAWLMGWI